MTRPRLVPAAIALVLAPGLAPAGPQRAKNADVAWENNSIKDYIDDVKVVDAKTVALHYTTIYPYQVMDANDGYILPKHVFGKIPYKDWHTRASWTAEAGVAGGPYRVVE